MTTKVPFLLRFATPLEILTADPAQPELSDITPLGSGDQRSQRESRYTRVLSETTDDE